MTKMHRENNSRKQFAARPIELAAALSAGASLVLRTIFCTSKWISIWKIKRFRRLRAGEREKLIAMRASDETLLGVLTRSDESIRRLIIFAFEKLVARWEQCCWEVLRKRKSSRALISISTEQFVC